VTLAFETKIKFDFRSERLKMSVSSNQEKSSICCDCPLHLVGICLDTCNGTVLFRDIIGHLEDGGYPLKLTMKFLNKTYERYLFNNDSKNIIVDTFTPSKTVLNTDATVVDSFIETNITEHDQIDSSFTVIIPKLTGNTNVPSHAESDVPVLTSANSSYSHSIKDVGPLTGRIASLKRTHDDCDELNIDSASTFHTKSTTSFSSSSSSSSLNSYSRKFSRSVPSASSVIAPERPHSSSSSRSSSSSHHPIIDSASPALSSMEFARLANIARNNQFMASLGIEAKEVKPVEKRKINIVSVENGT
jgi:hypothetical protein